MENFLNILELRSNLLLDESSIGCFIGISDQAEKCWKLAIYFGNEKACVIFEYDKGFVCEKLLQDLKSIAQAQEINKKHLLELSANSAGIINFINHFADKQQFEFYIYKINLLLTPNNNKIKCDEFLNTLELNLNLMRTFDEGDIVGFVRGWYHHVAILTDKSRMIVTHRYGEPEDGGNPFVVSGSMIGLPMDKG
jgi:hypothetical protein